jgi:hypothetical protein
MHYRSLVAAVAAICCACGAPAQSRPDGADAPRLWLGAGYWGGEASYRIGGRVTVGGQTTRVGDPISELTWPLEVATVGGGLSMPLGARAELRLSAMGVAAADSGTVANRDWLAPGVPWVRSESDGSLAGYMLYGDCLWWCDLSAPAAVTAMEFGVGVALYRQALKWEAANLDQWYPLNPDLPHDRVAGIVGTYDLDLAMPCLAVALRARRDAARLELRAGFAPFVSAEDDDDHLLRGIRAHTEATGVGGTASATLEIELKPPFFLRLHGEAFGFVADGTERDVTYAGPDAGATWTIDHEIESLQFQGLVALGASL